MTSKCCDHLKKVNFVLIFKWQNTIISYFIWCNIEFMIKNQTDCLVTHHEITLEMHLFTYLLPPGKMMGSTIPRHIFGIPCISLGNRKVFAHQGMSDYLHQTMWKPCFPGCTALSPEKWLSYYLTSNNLRQVNDHILSDWKVLLRTQLKEIQ